MNWEMWLPLLVLSTSLVTGAAIFFLPEERVRVRTVLNMSGALLKLLLVAWMMWGTFHEQRYHISFPVAGTGLTFDMRADALAMLFVTLSAFLWLLTTIYAIAYLERSPNRSRFFGFFSLCVSATVGIAFAGNLFTFLVFYEGLTLTTYPLVVHRGTARALDAGRLYLIYTLGGGAALLLGVVWLHTVAGPLDFGDTETLAALSPITHPALRTIFLLLIVGLGVKASLVPFHSWLPRAMVAPAPVSALLHAVAVVKAGAFGIARVVYDVYGIEFGQRLGVLFPLAVAASITVLYGSLRALYQDDLKRRLAFSTVSQVSYIALGVAIVGPSATIGGLVHLVHQGLMKITLFFCAGNLAETLGVHKISEMQGVGRRMPWTMSAFTIAALGMIGVPPMAGFVSKWYLAQGALQASQPWVLWVLAGSSLLNAGYFLPVLFAAWFRPPPAQWPHEETPLVRREAHPGLMFPPLVTGALSLLVGLLANALWSPLNWARLIVERLYAP